MAQLGSFSRAMQPQLRVASCASAVILSIQCVNLHFYLTFAGSIFYFGIIFVNFQNKIAYSAFFHRKRCNFAAKFEYKTQK